MISLLASADQREAEELVRAALVRSVGPHLVGTGSGQIALTIGDVYAGPVAKRIHFGALPVALRRRLSALSTEPLEPAGFCAAPAEPGRSSESSFAVEYNPRARRLGGREWRRPFVRFDFADEWNNLGYGAIVHGAPTWDIAEPVLVDGAFELAAITDAEGRHRASYAALVEEDGEALLWFNRPVGPIDSFEWRLVEVFLSSFGAPALPIVPVISEIPAGYDTLVSARLDCDEDIESARDLWTAYDDMYVPLSLAIQTRQIEDCSAPPLLLEAAKRPGAVLAHSATHAPNWGGSRETARNEGERSAEVIARATGIRPGYAVSPFHQTPAYAVEGLADAGFAGCIGGSISGDPRFNMARSGRPAGSTRPFVGVTGQCMMHGDCLVPDDPIRRYRQAFDLSFMSGTAFFYLDHPFSSRYRYGWYSEGARIAAHRELVGYISRRATRPLFLTAGRALDFAGRRAATSVRRKNDRYEIEAQPGEGLQVSVEYAGQRHAVTDGMAL